MIYFLNGFSLGFLTGFTCFLVQAWPADYDGLSDKDSLARTTGWSFGIVAGVVCTATGFYLLLR